MKLAVATSARKNLRDSLGVFADAKRLGVQHFWVPDQGFRHDPFLLANAIGSELRPGSVGLGLLNPYTRHPVQVARAVAGLASLGTGVEYRIAWGAGNPTVVESMVANEAANRSPVAACMQAISAVQTLLRGGTVNVEGPDLHAVNVQLEVHGAQVAQFIGTRGPKMLASAGALSDGILAEGALGGWGEQALTLASSKRPAGMDAVESWAWFSISVVTNRSEATAERAGWKPWVASLIASSSSTFLTAIGVESDLRTEIRRQMASGGALSAASLVPDHAVSNFVLIGNPEECAGAIHGLSEKGFAGACFLLRGRAGRELESIERLRPYVSFDNDETI